MSDVTDLSTLIRRADVCAIAVADAFRGDGEILANPIGTIPMIGGRLARATWEPDLMMTDSEATLITNDEAVVAVADRRYEVHNPYRRMFDLVWSGKRHVMMGATQVDKFGNQNIAALGGTPTQPRTQLLGFRGAPGNTINDTTSYWVPAHGPKVFVEAVDVVTDIGYDRAAALGAAGSRFHEIRHVISNLGVFDFTGPNGSMHLKSLHPGVTVDEVVAATGFDLAIDDDTPTTRLPTPDELELLDQIDPSGNRYKEVPDPA